jgi:hypothetical protein
MPVTFRRKDNLKPVVAEDKIGIAIRQGFEPLGDKIVNSLRSRSPQDRGKFKKGIRKSLSGRGFKTRMLVLNSTEHAEFVEKGREPGSFAPPDLILGWVRRKGLGASAFSIKSRRAIGAGTRRTFSRAAGRRRTSAQSLLQAQKSIAFLINRKIRMRGIKGKFLFRSVKSDYAGQISASITDIKIRVAQILNA